VYRVRHIQCPTCLQVVGKTLTIPSLSRPEGPKQRNAPRRLLGRGLSLQPLHSLNRHGEHQVLSKNVRSGDLSGLMLQVRIASLDEDCISTTVGLFTCLLASCASGTDMYLVTQPRSREALTEYDFRHRRTADVALTHDHQHESHNSGLHRSKVPVKQTFGACWSVQHAADAVPSTLRAREMECCNSRRCGGELCRLAALDRWNHPWATPVVPIAR